MSSVSGITHFTGKVILITGASSGIGTATATYFASLGANLALTGRNSNNLKRVGERCITSTGNSKPLLLTGDINNDEDVNNIIDSTMKHYGKLDVLVNNAGTTEFGTIESTDVQQYDRIFNTNVRAMYHLTNLAVPHLIATAGNIVNVSSVSGIRSFPGILAYCMSKSAVDQFTRCIALELAPKSVRVNCVNPGVIATNIHRRAGLSEEEFVAYLERSKTTHALGRTGEPIEVAKSIAFLASDHASFITGVTLAVDGGRHAMCPR